ncbi:MAG: hypothetical protein ACFFG0_56215, partial [Candidatus Thorarchaeota archaeon]
VSAATIYKYRRGFIAGYYRDVAGISGLAYNNPDACLWANRSGWFNDNITDPSVSWKEFIDPSAVISGMAAVRDPWVSLHEKSAVNLNQVDGFNSTQISTLQAAWVNFFRFDGRGSYRSVEGFTNEGAAAVHRYTDDRALWIYVGDTIYSDLLTKNIIGNIQVERNQVLDLEQVIMGSLMKIFNEGGIGNPQTLEIDVGLKPINSQLIDAIKTPPAERTQAQKDYIQNVQATRSETIRIYYDALGSIHELIIPLGGR